MNRYLLLLVLPFLSFVMTACGDDEEDVIAPDLTLMPGTWQVVSPGDQKIFGWDEILHITSSQIHEGYGGYHGYITTYFLTSDGTPRHDRVFTWSISEAENNQPLLDVVFQGDLDSDDRQTCNYSYRITKLTDTHMWWQVNANGDNSTIKFRRRNDIHIE